MPEQASGPLAGLQVVEMRSLGPGPFAGMMLSDLGATVIQIDRPAGGHVVGPSAPFDLMNRGRQSLALDLKQPGAAEVALRFIERADILIEGYRPGVMERLGLGPDVCLEHNPRLLYGRMTGWGQDGPWANRVGHDINYIGVTGVLHAMGRPESPPAPPLSLVGDFGGGAMLLVVGLLAALQHRAHTGVGQVVDAAITDGTSAMAMSLHGMLAEGTWTRNRGDNVIDSGAPFYDTYATADGGYIAVGAIEPQFWAALVQALRLPVDWLSCQNDRSRWPEMKQRLAELFSSRTRDDLVADLGHLDACVTPVFTVREATQSPVLQARDSFVTIDGVVQPAPAPRFSATPGRVQGPPPTPGGQGYELLKGVGYSNDEIADLQAAGLAVLHRERNAAR
ncbi:Alpha-methylacyl-CoA racemase [Mycolicibacterium rhodesiae JS60]|nr:Alpha-methylacyl-CoA racemase [Mycolicibacterium rhodesiae JS60]